jgi:hypothetical protein
MSFLLKPGFIEKACMYIACADKTYVKPCILDTNFFVDLLCNASLLFVPVT